MMAKPGPFTPDDLDELSTLVLETWRSGLDRDWSAPAGTLEWSCWQTADHVVDCVYSYAVFLAMRTPQRELGPGGWGELHATSDTPSAGLIDGLEAMTRILSAVCRANPSGARSGLYGWGADTVTGDGDDFAARGALEMVVHAQDVCAGLGLAFAPPQDLCIRLRAHTKDWPRVGSLPPFSDDAWSDLLEGSGRERVDAT
jgi:hypothetical protein